MAKKDENGFQREVVRKRQQKSKESDQRTEAFLVFVIVVLGCVYFFRQYTLSVDPPASEIVTPEDKPTPKKKPTPIALPPSGVLTQATSPLDVALGQLRFFLRPPLADENSSLPTRCTALRNSAAIGKNHYFVQLLDWETDAVITTALIRANEMVEISIPFGTYKLRYAAGSEWYGEKEMFGSEEMYEVTSQAYSFETAKFEFSMETPGTELGFYCGDGNLGRKRVKANQQSRGFYDRI